MLKYFSKIVLPSLAIMAGAAASPQACELSLESANQMRFEDYSSVDREARPQKITLRLRNDGDEACIGNISVDAVDGDGHLLGLAGEKMSYGIFSARETSQVLFQAGTQAQNQFALRVPAQSSHTLDMYMVIDRLQNLPAGTYIADLNLNIQSQALSLLDSMTIRVGANIRPSLQANFTGIGHLVSSENTTGSGSARQKAVLDLGELTPNETRKLGLQIRANAPVSIRVSSENSGALQHEYDEGEIPYGVRLNRQDLDLSLASVLNGYASPKKNGRTNPLTIRLSDFGKNVPAGNYSDVLTFRISAR